MDGYDNYGAQSPVDKSRADPHDRDTYAPRERDPYRDSRRRSPGGPPPPRRNRNRSRSPAQGDRYAPDRSSRDDHYRGRDDYRRERRPSDQNRPVHGATKIDRYVPGADPLPRPIPVNAIRDPLLEPHQVGFSWFSEWWKADQDIAAQRERQKTGRFPDSAKETHAEQRAKIQAAYDQYKLDWNARMSRLFVLGHKYDTWFRERYVPEIRDPLRSKIMDFRQGLFSTWESDLNAGVFDEFTLEGIYKTESNGAGGVVEREEGEAVAAAEVLGVSDLIPTKGADIRDPVAYMPTLLVKTITPAVPREKMEEFCKEHLGDGEGGYKWLSMSDPNPTKKFHRLGWIMLNALPEGAEEPQERRSSRDEEDGMTEDVTLGQEKPSINETTCKRARALIDNKTIQDPEKGDFTVHIGVHQPQENPRKKALWDLFSAPERVERDLDLAIRLVNKLDEEMGEGYDGYTKVEDKVNELAGKGYLQPPIAPAKAKKENVAEDGEDEMMEEGEEEQVSDEEDVDDEDLLIKKKKLDLLVEYLRRVHNFCFYCVFECDSVHELQRKCASGHLRRPRASLTSAAKETAKATATGSAFPLNRRGSTGADADENGGADDKKAPRTYGKNQLQKAFNWVKTFEEKLLQIIEPESVDLAKLGGKPLEEALEEELNKHVKQEDESKYRCKVPDCPKMFKGRDFWRKHVEKRHVEWLEKVKEDIELINRYVLDPARLAQGRNDSGSNGHFPVPNSMASGTPRGFSLNNAAYHGNQQMPMGGAMSFNPVMGNYPMAMAPFGMPGNVGPMRNNMRMNARAAGPYDNRGAGREPRRSISGRLTPPRSRNIFMEGGEHTVGPRQAVEGRTMRSYTDLDATGTAPGTTELDY